MKESLQGTYKNTARAHNADRAFLVKLAPSHIGDVYNRRRTVAWIRDGTRSVKDLRALAIRWNVTLPSDVRKGTLTCDS